METFYILLKFIAGFIIGCIFTLIILWMIVKQNGKKK